MLDYVCIYEMYITSVCIKVKRFSIKKYGFWIIKGLVCLFLLFWYCYNQLSVYLLLCLLNLFVLSLLLWSCISLELPNLGMNPGHLFNSLNWLLCHVIGALGSIFVPSWVNTMQST